MKVLILGGSQNVGYWTGLRYLEKGDTVTYLLRKPTVFDNNAEMKKYVESGTAKLVKGDVLNKDDVKKVYEVAGEGEGPGVEVILYSIGVLSPPFSFIQLI
jgi:NAD(P)-dependent dehydrogenase (short-subunit alcohol dehydrogenase family)